MTGAKPAEPSAFARYEPDIRKLRSTPELKRIGYDDEDVQAECRIAAWRAQEKWRAKPERPVGGVDELKWVRRAVKNALISQIRKAKVVPRRFDPSAKEQIQTELYGTSLSGAFGHGGEITPTPEADVEAAEAAVAVERAIGALTTALGEKKTAQLVQAAERSRLPSDVPSLKWIVQDAAPALTGVEVSRDGAGQTGCGDLAALG